jgi:hypothetical protein
MGEIREFKTIYFDDEPESVWEFEITSATPLTAILNKGDEVKCMFPYESEMVIITCPHGAIGKVPAAIAEKMKWVRRENPAIIKGQVVSTTPKFCVSVGLYRKRRVN